MSTWECRHFPWENGGRGWSWYAERRSPLSWFNADAVVDGSVQALLTSEVFLSCLNRHVTQQELNLLQFTTRNMAKASARTLEVVRRELGNVESCSVGLDDVPDDLLRHSTPPRFIVFADRPEHSPARHFCGDEPFIDHQFYPIRNRDGPNVTTFAHKIDNRPMLFSALEVVHGQFGSLMATKAASQQHCKKCPIAFAFQGPSIRELPELPGLTGSQPIAQPYAEFLRPFYATNSRGQFWAQDATISRLVCKPPDGSQTPIDGAWR